MRALLLLTLTALAACSEGAEQPKQKAAPAAQQLDAGQWEVTTEVTNVKEADAGPPAIRAKAGDKTTDTACIAEGQGKQPPPALFMGARGGTCDYRNNYMSNGRMNASIACKRPGLSGDILTSLDGKYTADSFEGTLDTTTYLSTSGDVAIQSKVSGRRTGACTVEKAA